MRFLVARGYKVVRSAGSHSPVDLLAGKGNRRLAVQCKTGRSRFTQWDRHQLLAWGDAFEAHRILVLRSPASDKLSLRELFFDESRDFERPEEWF